MAGTAAAKKAAAKQQPAATPDKGKDDAAAKQAAAKQQPAVVQAKATEGGAPAADSEATAVDQATGPTMAQRQAAHDAVFDAAANRPADHAVTKAADKDEASGAKPSEKPVTSEATVRKVYAAETEGKATDQDGVPIGDHLGGTNPQDNAAQYHENVKGHGDAPVTGALTARQVRTRVGDNPVSEEYLRSTNPDEAGQHSPTAAPLERTPNPVYRPPNIPEDTDQVGADTPPRDASAVSPRAAITGARLVDEDGSEVKIASVFEDGDGPENFRTVGKRVFIEEPLAGSTEHTTQRLLFPKGARVNVADVARLKRNWS